MQKKIARSFTRMDGVIAGLLILLFCVVGALAVDDGHGWGDDFAAYLAEGIAIADGRFEEQTKLNVTLHPSAYGGGEGTELVYSWGYPLVLIA